MYRSLKIALLLSALIVLCSSCNSLVHDDLSACPTRLQLQLQPRFDAQSVFNSEVNDAHVYIYNEENVCVREVEVGNEELSENNYAISIDMPVGEYSIVVWSGTTDADNYQVSDANVKLITDEERVNDRQLTLLWNGKVDYVSVEDYQITSVVVPMVKDTNTIVAVIHDDNSEDMPASRFSYEIVARNGELASDNSLMSDEQIHYKHYETSSEVIEGTINSESDELGEINVVRGELNTLRLTTDRPAYLYIRDNFTERTILGINLTQYILLARSHSLINSNQKLSDQDYLDTEHNHSLAFYFTKTGELSEYYTCVKIIINGWAIQINNSDL